MSRKTKEDYEAVFQAVKDSLANQHVVEGFVLDFEPGLWQSLKLQFPTVQLKGCVFHWTQAVWRHVQEYGLVTLYRKHQTMYRYTKQLFALPFLPAAHIRDAFNNLKMRTNTPAFQQLVDYMQRQWFNNSLHPVESWCVFQQEIRTNNDVEGWHPRLNSKTASTGVYKLIPSLRREAELVQASVNAGDLDRECNRTYNKLQTILTEQWSQYQNNEVTSTQFLKNVGSIYTIDDQE